MTHLVVNSHITHFHIIISHTSMHATIHFLSCHHTHTVDQYRFDLSLVIHYFNQSWEHFLSLWKSWVWCWCIHDWFCGLCWLCLNSLSKICGICSSRFFTKDREVYFHQLTIEFLVMCWIGGSWRSRGPIFKNNLALDIC